MDIRYIYTEFFPDPEKEHYLIDEKTESTLSFTADLSGDTLTFVGEGISGRFEFCAEAVWLCVEKSTDERFAVGNHCLDTEDSYIIE